MLLIFTVLFASAVIFMTVFWPGLNPNSKSRYDAGYDDGYTESYYTLCKNKEVNVEGDWDDKNYHQGYMAGQLSGAAKCDGEKRAKAFHNKNK